MNKTLPYPFGITNALRIPAQSVDEYVTQRLESIIKKVCTKEAADCLLLYHKKKMSLLEISEKCGICVEKIRMMNTKSINSLKPFLDDILFDRPLHKEYQNLLGQIAIARQELLRLRLEGAAIRAENEKLKEGCKCGHKGVCRK